MDVQITYETLFNILRKERSLEELQSLDDSFWSQIITFINESKAFFERTNSLEQEKARIKFQNINRILKEIYERREKKIVNLALNIVKTNNTAFADKRNMLPLEKEFFGEVIALLTKYKQGVLLQVSQGRVPLISVEEVSDEKILSDDTIESFGSKESAAVSDDDPVLKESSETSVEDKLDESTGSEEIPVLKEGTLIVKFKTDVPKFIGKNKKIFGPYTKGTITQLPVKIANILLKKGKVDSVMGSE